MTRRVRQTRGLTLFELIPLLVLLTPVAWHGFRIAGPIGGILAPIGWAVAVVGALAFSQESKLKSWRFAPHAVIALYVIVQAACFFVPPIVRTAIIGTGAVSGLLFIVVCGVGAILSEKRSERWLSKGHCGSCGYDLHGVDFGSPCPKCGKKK